MNKFAHLYKYVPPPPRHTRPESGARDILGAILVFAIGFVIGPAIITLLKN